MSKDVFEFKVSLPRYGACTDDMVQTMSISMKAPTYVFQILLDKYSNIDTQTRLAASELKIAMIEALLKGDWSFDDTKESDESPY